MPGTTEVARAQAAHDLEDRVAFGLGLQLDEEEAFVGRAAEADRRGDVVHGRVLRDQTR